MSQPNSYTLFLMRSTPYGGANAQEGVDALLAFAAFDQPVKVLFINEGALQLVQNQQPQQEKSIAKMINAFDMYDLNEIYIHLESLKCRGLDMNSLIGAPKPLRSSQVCNLIKDATHVISF